jgi:hypothetical protein
VARIRTIKPEFFTSLTIAALPVEARLTFIGLWTHVDDEGRCVDETRLIRAALWALDDRSFGDVEKDLQQLADASLIRRYTVDGKRFLIIVGWSEHQKINRPTRSKLPPPPSGACEPPTSENTLTTDSSVRTHGELTEDSPQERKGKEQGKEQGTIGPYVAHGGARERDEAPPTSGPPTVVEIMISEYRDNSPRGVPDKIAARLAEEIHALLGNGFTPDEIRHGLGQLRARRAGPPLLAAIVDELANSAASPGNVVALRTGRADTRPSTTDQRVAAGLALAAKFEAEEAAHAIQGAAS